MFSNKKEIGRLEGIIRELESRHNKLLDFLNLEGKYVTHSSNTYFVYTGGLNQELIEYKKREKCKKYKQELKKCQNLNGNY